MPAGSTLRSSGSIALGRRGGLLLDGGDTVRQGGAAQIARIFLVLVASRPVHGRAVVPDHEIADPPPVRIDELALVACSVSSRSKSIASGTGQPTMRPACEDRYSDLRPVL